MAEMQQNQPIVQVMGTESPWFWKVFGGAIISVITLLLAFAVNSVMTNINNNRIEMMTSITSLKEENISLREKVASLIQGQARVNDFERIIKSFDDLNKLSIKTLGEKVQDLKDRIIKLEGAKSEPKKENDQGNISQ